VGKSDFLKDELEKRKSNHLLRKLRSDKPLPGGEIVMDGHKMLNFCSNDYLGLSGHPLLRERAEEYLREYGAGSTASRLVCGNFDCFEKTENRIAQLTGREGALIFNSGFQTNVSLFPALTDSDSLILSDDYNHNSIIQGALLSRCRVERFHHNDLNHLEQLLKQNIDKGFSRILIATESIFSMDGDTSDIDSLIQLSVKYDSLLVVDEAHATGVAGHNGMGLASGKDVDILMGTFSKAAGSFGAYVAGSNDLREYLINFCYGLIYTTALPPSVVGSIDAAIELIPRMDRERADLTEKAKRLRSSLNDMGYNTGNSTTQIIPLIIGDEKETLRLSEWLEQNSVLAMTFRPPTVAKGESRIRLALSALHREEHIGRLLELLKKWREIGRTP
jgi:8-amino-7-oxononanoate synthase